MKLRTFLGVLLGSTLMVATMAAVASGAGVAPEAPSTEAVYDSARFNDEFNIEPQAFGLVDNSIVSLKPWGFQPWNQTSATALQTTAASQWCNELCFLEAQHDFPSGARITGIELDLHDVNAVGQVAAQLIYCPIGSDSCFLITEVTSGDAGTPGTTQIMAAANHTIFNGDRSYMTQVIISGGTNATRLFSYRVFYKRQISPAPGVATFQDVPTNHSFFVNVEALVASGITAGCGGANYCPNAFVTRGQMAAFLSRALGLHWDGYQ